MKDEMPPYSSNGKTCRSSCQESLPDLSRLSSRFSRTPLPRAGAPIWRIPRLRVFGPISERELHINVLELKVVILALRHCSITGPSCHDCYRQYHCCSLYQQTGWGPFPRPVVAGSRSVSLVTDSRHNASSQKHSRLPQCDS